MGALRIYELSKIFLISDTNMRKALNDWCTEYNVEHRA